MKREYAHVDVDLTRDTPALPPPLQPLPQIPFEQVVGTDHIHQPSYTKDELQVDATRKLYQCPVCHKQYV